MPWCPECGIEYREGFDTCSDCNCALSENPPPAEIDPGQESEDTDPSDSEPVNFGGALLMTTANSIEADMIEGLLNTNDIPVFKKYKDLSGYMLIYTGSVNSGVDIYVPSQLLDKAKDIVEANLGMLGDAAISDEELEAQALEAQPVDADPEDEEAEEEAAEDEEDTIQNGQGE